MDKKIFSWIVLLVFVLIAIIGPLAQTVEPEHGDPAIQVYGTSIFVNFAHFATPVDYLRLLETLGLIIVGAVLALAVRTDWD